jgi:hypothetical protein
MPARGVTVTTPSASGSRPAAALGVAARRIRRRAPGASVTVAGEASTATPARASLAIRTDNRRIETLRTMSVRRADPAATRPKAIEEGSSASSDAAAAPRSSSPAP